MRFFGLFKGLPYGDCCIEDFDTYRQYRNQIPKERVIAHIKTLDEGLACLCSYDFFTGKRLHSGSFRDGEFCFPSEFLHYYENYDIGIPYEYEEYLKKILKPEDN